MKSEYTTDGKVQFGPGKNGELAFNTIDPPVLRVPKDGAFVRVSNGGTGIYADDTFKPASIGDAIFVSILVFITGITIFELAKFIFKKGEK